MLLIAGGRGDPDLNWLAHAAEHRGLSHVFAFCNSHDPTPVHWNINNNTLVVDGKTIAPEDTSLYIRYSMFDEYGEDSLDDCYKLVENWYSTVKGWAGANPSVGMFNRDADVLEVNKPRNLLLAKESGFQIPHTHITNDIQKVKDPENWIVKVVGDGEATRCLDQVLESGDLTRVFNAQPWIIQRKLTYPELRIFRVGKWQFAFAINNDNIDSRIGDNMELKATALPAVLTDPMNALTDRLKMDFAAADFKTCPETGDYKFLEINSAPTFSGYDAKVSGELSDAMVLHLRKLAR